jgi:RNA polymerase sigma-70 factor (ECF subfamily)
LSSDLRRFIRRRVSDVHVAEDLLQETFVRVHRSIESLEATDRVAAWVYQIARNVVRDHHRRAAHTRQSLNDVDSLLDDEPDEAGIGQGNGRWLIEMIDTLPDRYRSVLRLSEIEGCKQQEVADQLGLSLSGVKSRIQRGRSMLKSLLESCCTFELSVRGTLSCEAKPNQTTCRDCDG